MRFAPQLIAILLCGTALSGCVGDPTTAERLGIKSEKETAAEGAKAAPTDLDSGVRQAQLFRLAGDYPGAVRVLSQLMLVASDDPRVVAEYGKTLAQQGRSQDAIPFLNRAAELQPNNWTVYSAMGVAYDQLGDQNAARNAYEHALALRPGEPGVLNNYALSRMLANDPATAQKLMDRARIAGGGDNAQIARNMAMIQTMAPQEAPAQTVAYSVKRAAPAPIAAAKAPQPVKAATAAPQPFVNVPQPQQMPSQAPRQLMPQAQDQAMVQPQARDNRVVMQPVSIDPLAGPIALHMPIKPAKVAVRKKIEKDAQAAARPVPVSMPKPAPAKVAAIAPPELPPLPSDKNVVKAKTAAAPAAAAKPAAPVKLAAAPAAKAEIAIKAADVKAAPVKIAKKDAVPALRLAADAY